MVLITYDVLGWVTEGERITATMTTIATTTTMTKTTIDNHGDYFWYACLYNRREGKRITTTMTKMTRITTTTTMTTATTIDDDGDHLLG